MATTFGSAIADATGQPGSSVGDISHARARKTLSRFAAGVPADGDFYVIGYFKSSDQVIDIRYYTDGGGTGGAFDLGLWSADFSNGATTLTDVDQNLYATLKATGTPILHGSAVATIFAESATLNDFDRGKALWVQAGATVDPGVTYALVAEFTTTVDGANEMAFEVDYVAGD